MNIGKAVSFKTNTSMKSSNSFFPFCSSFSTSKYN